MQSKLMQYSADFLVIFPFDIHQSRKIGWTRFYIQRMAKIVGIIGCVTGLIQLRLVSAIKLQSHFFSTKIENIPQK